MSINPRGSMFGLILILDFFAAVSLTAAGSSDFDYRSKSHIQTDSEMHEDVDPASGSLIIRSVDLKLPGNGGMDILVQRYYNTKQLTAALSATHIESFTAAALGPGWRLGVAPRVFHDNAFYQDENFGTVTYVASMFVTLNTASAPLLGKSSLILELPDGTQSTFYVTAPYTALTKNNWKLRIVSGVATLYSPDGVLYQLGNISNRKIGRYVMGGIPPTANPGPVEGNSITYMDALQATDANGNWLAYEYQQIGTAIAPWSGGGARIDWDYYASNVEKPSSVPKKITSSDGREVTFTYDAATGRLLTMTDNVGGARTWQYQYLTPDSNNSRSLSKVIRPDGTSWEFGYAAGTFRRAVGADTFLPLNTVNATARKLISLKYPTGGVVSYTYGYYNLSQGIGGGVLYSRGERVATRSLSTGHNWTYSYVRGGIGQYDVTTIVGPEGTEVYKYVGPGHAIKTTVGIAPPYQNNAWRVGQLIEKTHADGSIEAYEWVKREMLSAKDYLYELGTVWDEKTWIADLYKRTLTRNGASYVVTFLDYDAYGNPAKIIESGPNGGARTTDLVYHNDLTKWIIGVVKDTASAGWATTRTFDVNGNLLSISRGGVAAGYTYDVQGNVQTMTLPRGLVHSYSNYFRGIARREEQPEGVVVLRTVDGGGNILSETNGEGHTWSYAYDGLNRLTSASSPIGNSRSIIYTATAKTVTRGALIEITQYDGFARESSISLGGIVTSYQYDAMGRRSFQSNPGAVTGTTFLYDTWGRLKRKTNADGSYEESTYGAGSRSIKNERGFTSVYNYRSYADPSVGQLMSITAPEASASIVFTRNDRDLITSAVQGGVTRVYQYDTRGYLVSSLDPETGLTQYGRDDAGNMISRQVGVGEITSYGYDGLNRLVAINYPTIGHSVVNTYNAVNKLLSSSTSGVNRGYVYDQNGNLTSESIVLDGITLTAGYAYNLNDQLAAITYPHSGLVVNYNPDVLGRPTQASGFVSSIEYWDSGQVKKMIYANGVETSYGQNSRLWPSSFITSKLGVNYANTAYGYDGVGNLNSIGDSVDVAASRVLGYDNVDRLISASGSWGSGSISYSGSGNIENQILGSTSLFYAYDANNRLGSMAGSRIASYTYDLMGNVTSDSVNSYAYDDVPNLRIVNQLDALSRIDYVYDGTNQRVCVEKLGVKRYEMYGSHGNQLIEFIPSAANKITEYIYIGGRRVAQRVGSDLD